MSYRNERFYKSFLSLDCIRDGDNSEKHCFLSDNGEEARRIRYGAEWADDARGMGEPRRAKCIEKARRRLVESGLSRLLPVLDQVVANGKNRRESILKLAVSRHLKQHSAERFYDRGVGTLLMLFSPNKIKGETHLGKSVCL